MRDSGIIHKSYYKAAKKLPPEARAEAYDAYFEYVLGGIEYTGDNLAIICMLEMISDKVDAAHENYQKKVDTMQRNAKARSAKKSTAKSSDTISHDIENKNTISHDIGSDSVNDNDIKEKETLRVSKEKPTPTPCMSEDGIVKQNLELLDRYLAEMPVVWPGKTLESLRSWLTYKGESGFLYRKSAMKEFLLGAQKQLSALGEEKACGAISTSIAAGWKNIVWERSAPPGSEVPRKNGAPNRFNNFTQPDPGYERIAEEKLKSRMPFGGDDPL